MHSKILLFFFSIALFTNLNAQGEYDVHTLEAKFYQEFTDSRQADCYCNLSGTYNAVTTTPNWCNDQWNGTVIIESTGFETYNISTVNSNGDLITDFTMGSYYACYGNNATTAIGTLALVNDCGLSFTGTTQWGDVFTMEQYSFSGNELSITWYSDYGSESGTTVLTRTDGMVWEDFACEQCAVSAADSMALVDFYNATGGANWENKWDLNEPVEEWHGITVNQECEITEISLSNNGTGFSGGNNLVGTLPASIANISTLEILDVAHNEGMSGSIPMEYGNFENLQLLRLFNCSFSGDLPSSLANLTNLVNISLGQNDFSGPLSKDLLELPNLRFFQCPQCLLDGNIPSNVNATENFMFLSVSYNLLSGEIPLWIADAPSLTGLWLSGNQLTGSLPNNITGFKGASIDLSYNKLSGTIPEGWEGSSIISLTLNNNELEGNLPSDLHALEFIQLQSNKLSGPIPTDLLANAQFTNTYLHDNNFEGCLNNLDVYCNQTMHTTPSDTFIIRDVPYYYYYDEGYSFMNNPKLPWSGDLTEYCMGTDQVGAPCDDGNLNTSGDSITMDCQCAGVLMTSVNALTSVSDLAIFPNPASATSELTISFDALNNEDLQLSIIDILGREMSLQNHKVVSGSNQLKIRNQNLTPGIYYLRISNQEKSISKSFYIH